MQWMQETSDWGKHLEFGLQYACPVIRQQEDTECFLCILGFLQKAVLAMDKQWHPEHFRYKTILRFFIHMLNISMLHIGAPSVTASLQRTPSTNKTSGHIVQSVFFKTLHLNVEDVDGQLRMRFTCLSSTGIGMRIAFGAAYDDILYLYVSPNWIKLLNLYLISSIPGVQLSPGWKYILRLWRGAVLRTA